MIGTQLIIGCSRCNSAQIDDPAFIRGLIHGLAALMETHIVKEEYHRFLPTGVTGVAIISASHISIHSWPEHSYLSVDIFSCRPVSEDRVLDMLKRRLGDICFEHQSVLRETDTVGGSK